MSTSSYTIKPALPADVKVLANISELASRTDVQTIFKKLATTTPESFNDMWEAPISSWMPNPRVRILKAVDDATGEIIGWVAWATRGYDAPPATAPVAEEEAPPEPMPTDVVERLNRYTGDDFAAWMGEKMPPGTKCRFICSICVLPEHQGKGIGKTFLNWGTDQADADGVFCWVHASEAGYPVFLRKGYKVSYVSLEMWVRVTNGECR